MKEQVVTSQEQQVTEQKKQNKPRKWFRMAFIISVLSAFLSVSAFAEGESISTVTASFSTLTDMIGQVFSSIVGNPVLVVFLAAALLRVGIGLFRSLRRAAR